MKITKLQYNYNEKGKCMEINKKKGSAKKKEISLSVFNKFHFIKSVE